MFKSKLAHLSECLRRCWLLRCMAQLQMKQCRRGQEWKEKRRADAKRSCDILLSGWSVAQPVSLDTHEARFLCCCQNGVWGVCVLLCLQRWSHAQISRAEREAGWEIQTHVYHWRDGWIPFIWEWLTVPSLPYWPLSSLYLTHTFPFTHPRSIFASSMICICPLPRVLWSIFLSLLHKSDPLTSIWHRTNLNVFLSLSHYQRNHLLFIRNHVNRAKGARLVMAAAELDRDRRATSFKWLLLIDAW